MEFVANILSTSRSTISRSKRRLDPGFWAAFVFLFAGACGHKVPVTPPIASSTPSATGTRPAVPVRTPLPPTKPEVEQPAAVSAFPGVGPPIRIGLATGARELNITASGEFLMIEKVPEATRQVVNGDLQVRVERSAEENHEIYRVQVVSLTRRESAEALARKLTEDLAQPVVVRENPDSGICRVRIGVFSTREEALKFASGPLANAGYTGIVVVRENASGNGELKLALRGSNLFRVSGAGFLFQPVPGTGFLRLDGKPYRGNLDLSLNKNGFITAVNILGTEEYLLGVVPGEMSPSTYPEFAALAAQSIAARTYALKNLGKFAAEGFDLTADIRTQVYGGVAQEREGASEAVRSTSGMAIYYQGNLIDAMYSSTCGGRTEDFASVFDAAPVPYLRSVVCAIENDGSITGTETVVQGVHSLDQSLFAEDGSNANRDIELAQVLGLGGHELFTAWALSQPAHSEEIRGWVKEALKISGKVTQNEAVEQDLATRGDFARYAAEHFLGKAEIQKRITSTDSDYYLSNLKDGADVPSSAQKAITLLLQTGLWRPYPDNSIRPREFIRRADALSLLLHLVESARPDFLRSGLFEAPKTYGTDRQGRVISVKWGNKVQQFSLAGELRLFKVSESHSTPAGILRIIGNEKLRFHVASNGSIDFMEVELNPTGASSDRYSPAASWQVTLSRSVVADKLRPLAGNVGDLLDLRPARIGASGRAVQMEAVGSQRTVVLNGNKVRGALGLRDTLVTIRRTYNPSGSVENFVINGRGWGHGVGLCQVGAFGMARAGRSYEEILKTYYQGVELRKAY